jgi:replicative DNA helicase
VLGSILIYPDAYLQVASFLKGEDFYIHRHRWIWEAISQMHEEGTPIDYLTIIDALDRSGKLEEIGGSAYLTALINTVPSSLHAETYGQIVTEMAVRRRMLAAANQIARSAYQLDQPLDESLDQAESAVFDVSSQTLDRDFKPVASVVSDVYDDVTQPTSSVVGISTGFVDLEKLLGGLRKSDFIVLAGRPGMGKTSLLLSILRYASVNLHKHAALFSLEMDNENVVHRLLSQLSEIPLRRIRDRKLRDEDWDPFVQSNQTLGGAPLYLDDTPVLTPPKLRTQCRRLALEHQLDLVVVDYLQLMSGGGRFDNRTHEVSHISRQLKILARELQVPVLVSAQLSRAVEQRQDKRPTLADLRESGAIEQDSDIVMFLYRDEHAGVTKLAVEKHRNGPTGIVDLVFRGAYTRFENAVSS